MQIDSSVMTKNGEEIPLDISHYLVENRSMIFLRTLAEVFEVKVEWDADVQLLLLPLNSLFTS